MGFRLNRTMRLEFSGDLDGLEIRVRSVAFGTLAEFLGVEMRDPRAAEIMADTFVDWNYEDDNGQPLPATADGLRQVPPPVFTQIVRAWTEAQSGVTAPLDLGSTSGETASIETAGLSMETLP